VARTVHERDRLELCPIGSAAAASDRKFCRHRFSLRHERTSMPARISAHMHTTVLQDRSHAVTQLSLFDQRGRATGWAGAKTLHFACVFLRQQPSQRRASAAVRWRVGEAGYSRPCCSSRSDALLRDLEWESKPDFFIERHCISRWSHVYEATGAPCRRARPPPRSRPPPLHRRCLLIFLGFASFDFEQIHTLEL